MPAPNIGFKIPDFEGITDIKNSFPPFDYLWYEALIKEDRKHFAVRWWDKLNAIAYQIGDVVFNLLQLK